MLEYYVWNNLSFECRAEGPYVEEPESMPESARTEEPPTRPSVQATPEKMPTPVSMPLPALNEVTTSR